MSGRLAVLSTAQKNLPLPLRQSYGWLRRTAVPHPIRDNPEFRRVSRWLQETQWWPLERLRDYQLAELQSLLRHAYEHVPHYRRAFDACRLKPGDVRTLDDLGKIPILVKDEVRESPDEFLATNVERNDLRFWTTGGSTGQPVTVYHCRHTGQVYECAYRYRQWGWAGYRFWDRKAWLIHIDIGNLQRDGKKALWDYNTDENQLVLAARDMTEETMAVFCARLRQFRPRFLTGIPSVVEILARYLQRNGIQDVTIPGAIFCLSEALYSWQRELIEAQFKTRIFAEYGMSEHAADAVECERHEGYHVSMEYGIVELLDKNNQPITEPGVLGQVVGTGLHQRVMPFIRYATGDLALWARRPCSCGRELTLIEDFKGRSREFFVSRTGRLIPVHLVWTDRDPVWTKIREMNFLQERKGEIVARVVKAPQFTEQEIEDRLLAEIYKVLGDSEFHVELQFLDHLPRSTRVVGQEIAGKLSMLEQKLPIGFEQFDQGAGPRRTDD